MKMFLIIAAAVVLLALIVFPEFRKKLKVLIGGFLNVFVEDAAKTPEGAAAVYTQAIEEKQSQYNKAAATLNKLSGELKHTETAIENIKREIVNVEANCEKLVKANELKDAEIFASRRAELLTELEQKTEYVKKLVPMVADATQIYETLGKQLRELKINKKRTVEKLKMNNQFKDMLSDMDELRKDTATAKMLDAVIDGSNNLQKEVDGARVAHENRLSTKIEKAENKASQLQNSEYLDSLKKKYERG